MCKPKARVIGRTGMTEAVNRVELSCCWQPGMERTFCMAGGLGRGTMVQEEQKGNIPGDVSQHRGTLAGGGKQRQHGMVDCKGRIGELPSTTRQGACLPDKFNPKQKRKK